MKRIFVIIAVLAAGLVGCASSGGGGGSGDSYTVLEAGSHSAIKEQKTVDIHDQATFKDLWDKTFGTEASAPKMPDIDFTKQTVVAYFMGEMKHGGYVIRIDRAEPSKDVPGNYDVDFMVIMPGANCPRTTMEITHPYLFAVVPSTSPISFNVKQRNTPACG